MKEYGLIEIDCPDCKHGYTSSAGGTHWCNTCNRGGKGHNKGTVFLCSYEFIDKISREPDNA